MPNLATKIVPVVVGGTGESFPGDNRYTTPRGSMLEGVVENLDTELFTEDVWVGYPAEYGSPMPFSMSMKIGIDNLNEKIIRINPARNPIVLLGYSQGAAIIRSYMGRNTDKRIIGIGQVADPMRRRLEAIHADPGGYGVMGEGVMPKNGAWVLSVAAPRDPICSLRHDSLLRHIADFSGFFSTDPATAIEWMRANIEMISSRKWQLANLTPAERFDFGRLVRAIDEASGYLPAHIDINGVPRMVNPRGGRHTCYDNAVAWAGQTYLELLASEVNKKAQQHIAGGTA